MAAKPSHPASERVAQSLRNLASSAAQLNIASDELTRAIGPIDAALKKLNVGMTVWHQYVGSTDHNGDYWGRRIGYAKVAGKWGLALSTISGNQMVEEEHGDEWLFNDAPRWMRLEALDHVPAMLESLVNEVGRAATELKKKSAQARELAETISAVTAQIVPDEE